MGGKLYEMGSSLLLAHEEKIAFCFFVRQVARDAASGYRFTSLGDAVDGGSLSA